ncbi:hypothetical protein [Pseudobacteriovorax antillogorgiicola]|uniref:Imelysin n=1 Tax=Pseudobacteriovorax antillogorgiicola TaxID=1513793 RepID=A0A1Y6B982_9BACT|nr:hypothetical protein [Pseudobacteriovorax antillogorgiicola]TCS59432.1 hypothetical protein EDD56_101343 [Pseudobacteriovorax antillogorgiicola]SME88332.1 hypothetical protein SAMN06296036_101142 [Pseudobacteriovorax antillogorgiicola]
MIRYALGVLATTVSLGAVADEAQFKTADDLFALREGSVENTQAARQKYLEIADSGVKGADLVRAIVGAARTLIYEGEALTGMTSDDDVQTRRALFKDCFDNVTQKINPANLGYASPAYYYFTASCMGYYAQVSGTLENLANVKRLNDTLNAGYETQGGNSYEGGGLNRVKAAVTSNPKAKPIPGGLYNPEAALVLINDAIASEAYPGNYEGTLFCENYRRKVDVLVELERPADAKATADQAVEEFEFLLELEEVPAVLVAETKHCVAKIQEKAATL